MSMDTETIELLQAVERWHRHQVKQLELVRNHPDAVIKFQGDDGSEVELTKEQSRGFRVGVELALSRLGKLPFSISVSEDSDEEE